LQSNRNYQYPSVQERLSGAELDQNKSTFERLLDSEEAARLLRIHPKTLQRMARNGDIRGVQIGKLWRFRASHLNDWMEGRFSDGQLGGGQ
jgi:excisionase family DNA binding protein